MAAYEPRVVDSELDELLLSLPALAIEGAKGVGKTASASRRARSSRHLDDPQDLLLAQADPARLLDGPLPLLIDEWQRLPPVWDLVRRAVDRGARPGSYLLTGSAAPHELPVHSGAGRIPTIRLRPYSLAERGLGPATVSLEALLSGRRAALAGSTDVGLGDYAREIIASGFPGIRHMSPRARRLQLDGYIRRIVEHDLREAGHTVRAPATLRRWLMAYAAATSTTATFETIRRAASPGEGVEIARSTAQPYRETLERLFILDPLPSWAPTRNRMSRLAQPAKHHLADPALAARLLDLDEEQLLTGAEAGPPIPRDGVLLGALFESLVALSVRVYAQAVEATTGHLRTKAGRQEVDIIVERGSRVVAIEVKLSPVVTDGDVAHLHWLASRLGDGLADAIVVTTGRDAFRRTDGIGVVPAALLGP